MGEGPEEVIEEGFVDGCAQRGHYVLILIKGLLERAQHLHALIKHSQLGVVDD